MTHWPRSGIELPGQKQIIFGPGPKRQSPCPRRVRTVFSTKGLKKNIGLKCNMNMWINNFTRSSLMLDDWAGGSAGHLPLLVGERQRCWAGGHSTLSSLELEKTSSSVWQILSECLSFGDMEQWMQIRLRFARPGGCWGGGCGGGGGGAGVECWGHTDGCQPHWEPRQEHQSGAERGEKESFCLFTIYKKLSSPCTLKAQSRYWQTEYQSQWGGGLLVGALVPKVSTWYRDNMIQLHQVHLPKKLPKRSCMPSINFMLSCAKLSLLGTILQIFKTAGHLGQVNSRTWTQISKILIATKVF